MSQKFFILNNEYTYQCMKKMINKSFTIVVGLYEINLKVLKIQLYVVNGQKESNYEEKKY